MQQRAHPGRAGAGLKVLLLLLVMARHGIIGTFIGNAVSLFCRLRTLLLIHLVRAVSLFCRLRTLLLIPLIRSRRADVYVAICLLVARHCTATSASNRRSSRGGGGGGGSASTSSSGSSSGSYGI